MSRGRKETRLYRLVELRKASYRKARQIRKFIFDRLGRVCRKCGGKRRIEFDHPRGRTWKTKDFSNVSRMKMYLQDFKAGKLSVLCRWCNASDGQRFRKRNTQTKPKGECHV